MGLTIGYALKAPTDDLDEVREIVETLRRHALDLPFKSVSEVVELHGDECDFELLEKDHEHLWMVIQACDHLSGDGGLELVKPEHLIAFSTAPGPGCEQANFGLCRYPESPPSKRRLVGTNQDGWCWSSFCKTQYASSEQVGGLENFLRCHVTVVHLLDRAAEMGILDEVNDEGGYFKSRDVAALAKMVGEMNVIAAAIVGGFKDALGGGHSIQAPILSYPDFEHLEAKGQPSEEQ